MDTRVGFLGIIGSHRPDGDGLAASQPALVGLVTARTCSAARSWGGQGPRAGKGTDALIRTSFLVCTPHASVSTAVS